uniref:G-protein coupled receptors family 1 profile domain-containing protein n=1 Tax=Plectus sambesii TaxID=2011161 RepID=A0A914W0T0_9BILA
MNVSQSLINSSLTQLEATKWASVGQIVVGIVGVVTNSLIIWTIVRQAALRNNSCFVLIGQLAFADWIVGASFLITGIKRLIRLYCRIPELLTQVQCGYEMFFPYFGQSASLSLALAIGIERFIAVAFPLKFIKQEKTIGKIIALLAWSYAIIDSGFLFYESSSTKILPACTVLTAGTDAFDEFQDIHKTVVIVAIMATYALVFLTMTMQLKKAQRQNRPDLVAMKKNLQVKTARMLVVVAAVYLMLQITTRVAQALLFLLPVESRPRVGPFIRMIMIVNSDIHFFIYFSMSTEFRELFKRTFGSKLSQMKTTNVSRQLPDTQGTNGTGWTNGSRVVRHSSVL